MSELLLVPPLGDLAPRGWKATAVLWCRELVARTPDGVRITGSDDLVLRLLAERHQDYEEKAGCGISHFSVTTVPPYRTRSLVLHRTDGSQTDISWRMCISPSSHRQDVLLAMRRAVTQQATDAKSRLCLTQRVCELCSAVLPAAGVHLDHYPVSFLALATAFCAPLGGWSAILLEKHGDGRIGCDLTSAHLSAWQEFHQDRASYRLLHAACHLSQRTRGTA